MLSHLLQKRLISVGSLVLILLQLNGMATASISELTQAGEENNIQDWGQHVCTLALVFQHFAVLPRMEVSLPSFWWICSATSTALVFLSEAIECRCTCCLTGIGVRSTYNSWYTLTTWRRSGTCTLASPTALAFVEAKRMS